MGRSCNPTYVVPVCLVSMGALCMAAGFVLLALLYGTGDLPTAASGLTSGKSVYVMVLCGLGLVSLVLGSCSCCTLQQRAASNWHECQRLQRSHHVQLGSPEDPESQAQPRVSGYDPRYSPWPPN